MPEEESRTGRGVEITGALAGAGVGALVAGPAGALVSAAVTPLAIDLIGKAWDELRGRREANVVAVVDTAATQNQLSIQGLLAKALDHPDQSRLLFATLQAASTTIEQDKIAALGRCLANGVDDVARVDEEGLIVRALADLDPVHVRALDHILHSVSTPRDIHYFLLGDNWVQAAMTAPDVSGAVIAVLERHGLVIRHEEIEEGQGGKYATEPKLTTNLLITTFGALCLNRLQVT